MVRKEAFVQEKARLDAELKFAELNAAEIMRINERIVEDEMSTSEEILEASRQNTALKLELLAQESDLELAELNSRLDLALISQIDFEQQKELIKQNFADRSLILLEQNLDAELQLTEDVEKAKFDIANNIGAAIEALFEEHTIAAKFAAIAQALINTYLGATAAFAQTPGGIVIKSIAAGLATAMGLANVAKIRKVQKGSSDSGGGISSGTITTPRGTFRTGQAADGGIATQGITDTIALTKPGMIEALSEAPQKNVLVVEEVTVKQGSQKAISQVTTV